MRKEEKCTETSNTKVFSKAIWNIILQKLLKIYPYVNEI